VEIVSLPLRVTTDNLKNIDSEDSPENAAILLPTDCASVTGHIWQIFRSELAVHSRPQASALFAAGLY
jgi:hypothetical protein